MNGIALFTEFYGSGSFNQIVTRVEDDEEPIAEVFSTGQWVIRAEVGDELALFHPHSDRSFRVGKIINVLYSGWDRAERKRHTFIVETIENRVLSLDARTERGTTLRDRSRAVTVKYAPGLRESYITY